MEDEPVRGNYLPAECALRCLPNTFFIGASKCGTTTLANQLGQHPSIKFGVHEVHRFDRSSYAFAPSWAEAADELASSPVLDNGSLPLIHYTPHYLFAPTVPFEMRKFYPEPDTLKFIVILRDPVARAVSSYWFKNSYRFTRDHQDSGSADDFTRTMYRQMSNRKAYEQCLSRNVHKTLKERLESCFGSRLRNPKLGCMHIDKSIYHDQLERWFHNFPCKNFLIISLEQFNQNPERVFERVCRFMGVRAVGDRGFASIDEMRKVLNQTYLVSDNIRKQPIPEQILKDMTDFYRPYNKKLHHLLGEEFGYPT